MLRSLFIFDYALCSRFRVKIEPITIGFLSALLLVAARGEVAAPEIHENKYSGEPLSISEWRAVGPFDTKSDQEALALALSDDEPSFIASLMPESTEADTDDEANDKENDNGSPVQFKTLERMQIIDFYSAFRLAKKDLSTNPPSFYAQAVINSKKSGPAYLLLSGGLFKIWINGEAMPLMKNKRKYAYEAFNGSLPITLKEGQNILLIKAARVRGSCGLIAEIVPTADSTIDVLMNENRSFLKYLLISEAQPLVFNLRGLPSGFYDGISLEITDHSGSTLDTLKIDKENTEWAPGQNVAAGIYRAIFTAKGKSYIEDFLIGDLASIVASLRNEISSVSETEEDKINYGALLRRLDILLDRKNKAYGDPEWERKCVYTVSELRDAVERHHRHQSPWVSVPGLHLLGFRSEIDGVVRHYRLYVPSFYRPGQKLALGVMVATSFSGALPFIESSFVAHHLDAEEMAKMAEKYKMGFLWLGYPAQPNGNPCEFTHFEEVMADVEKHYDLDEQRIYLLAPCKAAIAASLYAERWPNRFAALGLLDPIAQRSRILPRDESSFRKYPAYNSWISENSPLWHIKELGSTPVYVAHDDGAPGHGSLLEAEDVATAARKAGVDIKFERVPLSLGHFRGWEELLGWASQQRRLVTNHELGQHEKAMLSRTGPVMRAFAESFIVVQGTQGDPAQCASIDAIVNQFKKTWARAYYGSCQVVKDSEVTDAMERRSNLVLIGNADTNSVWSRLQNNGMPTLDKDFVMIGTRRFFQKDAFIEMISRHPKFKERRLVLIGAWDLSDAKAGSLDLSFDGWFDYAIWTCSKGESSLDIAERFEDESPAIPGM